MAAIWKTDSGHWRVSLISTVDMGRQLIIEEDRPGIGWRLIERSRIPLIDPDNFITAKIAKILEWEESREAKKGR